MGCLHTTPEVAYLTPDRTPRLVKAPEGRGVPRREGGRKGETGRLTLQPLCTDAGPWLPGPELEAVANVKMGAGRCSVLRGGPPSAPA